MKLAIPDAGAEHDGSADDVQRFDEQIGIHRPGI